ncbi:MAG: prolipoprotein diacylglyceryl transferase [Candidatus Omnitrophica bacterium]|nr:prolipoprotein diacylglyceryl transferase [Candidatus Omnitrophota bacterium]
MYPFDIVIGSFNIGSYDIFYFAAFAVLVVLALILLDKDSLLNRRQVIGACAVMISFAVLGAAFVHILLKTGAYSGKGPIEILSTAGQAFLGGALFGFLSIYIYCRYSKISFLYMADYIIPFAGIHRLIGRIGCLLTGCCHGTASDLPWAVYAGDGILRQPTQAYMMILGLSIFVAGRLYYKKLRDVPGAIFFSAIIMYGVGRFFVEFFRVDSPALLGSLKLSQFVLFLIVIYGAIGLYRVCKRGVQKAGLISQLRGMFLSFAATLVISAVVILAILTFVPKSNFPGEIIIGKGDAAGVSGQETTFISTFRTKAREYASKAEIRSALEAYRIDNGQYPTEKQGLKALLVKPDTGPLPQNWSGPYTNKPFNDEKGRPYKYTVNGEGPASFCTISTN